MILLLLLLSLSPSIYLDFKIMGEFFIFIGIGSSSMLCINGHLWNLRLCLDDKRKWKERKCEERMLKE
jgi:hypothetical protein